MSENPFDPSQTSTPPPPPSPSQDHPSGVAAEQRQWAMFAHLSAIAGAVLTSGVGAWGTFLGPLIIWLIKKDTMPFVDDQAKEALNFNITVAIVFFALWVLVFVTLGIGFLIAIPAWFVIGIAWLVFTIVAAIKANDGVAYRYPFTLRLVK
ncbi:MULTISPECIES: DUF4870 domain-containing protein [unclassified Lysobacter]|uniref:DUF4870 domain-containing protein n=1 Tax=unclassified Lysobacter TaxID=2635362 RepID=UPI00211253AC|nr:DUF4870 domain-containing protein [Lysobacter sp. MMG2]